MSLEASNSSPTQKAAQPAGAADSKARPEFPWTLELALSGGGLRAAAYALGALIYLCHSGANTSVRNITSVSGGSLTNGFVACNCDFGRIEDFEEFRPHASRLIRLIANHGLNNSIYSYAFGAVLFCLALPLIAGLYLAFTTSDTGTSFFAIGLIVVSVVVIGMAVPRFSWAISAWMGHTFLQNDDGIERIGQLSKRRVDHVFCATDLNRGFPYFFSTAVEGRQFSRVYGLTGAQDVPIVTAVQASAAFPPIIPPVYHKPPELWAWLPSALEPHWQWSQLASGRFSKGPHHVWLTDGGAFNNFGTDWHSMRILVAEDTSLYWTAGKMDILGLPAALREHDDRYGEIQLAMDASQPEGEAKLRWLRWPLIGLFRYATRTMEVMYASTLLGRADEAVSRAIMQMRQTRNYWRASNPQRRTVEEIREVMHDNAVKIYVPYSLTLKHMSVLWRDWQREQGLETREDDEAETYARIRQDLKGVWKEREFVKTTFKKLGTDTTLSLVVSGYLMTRQALAGAFGFKPKDIPDAKWFEELLKPPSQPATAS